MKDLALIMYSHSSYKDVCAPYFSQTDELFDVPKKYIFIDDCDIEVPEGWEIINYDPSKSYSQRVSDCLSSVDAEYVLFTHEDMFLYSKPNVKKLQKYFDILKIYEEMSFVKLIRGTEDISLPVAEDDSLYWLPENSEYRFAVQPTIWKKSILHQIYLNVRVNHIREFEPYANYYCSSYGIKGAFHFDGEEKRGEHHYDSGAYPYVATAIVKGKWNLSQYEKELEQILEKNKINCEDRGVA